MFRAWREQLHPIDKIALVLAVVGVAFMAYLVTVHFSDDGGSLCDLSPGFSCQIVNKSIFSEVLGVPVSLLGMAYFATVISLTLAADRVRHWRAVIRLFTVGSLVFSVYLSGIEQFWLGSICLFCEGSKLLMLGILAATETSARRAHERMPSTWYAYAVAAGGAFTMVMRMLQT